MTIRAVGLGVALLVLTLSVAAATGPLSVDAAKSSLTVRVYKTGLFSAFAHDHEISAPISQGSFSEDNPTVELAVDARKLKVMDKDVSDKDRAQIQQTMLGPTVLDSEKFPEIRFHSTHVEPQGPGKWILQGELTVRAQTRPIKVNVEGGNGHYRGSSQFKQTDFGIDPISLGGGTVKVKNELRVEFEIVGQGSP